MSNLPLTNVAPAAGDVGVIVRVAGFPGGVLPIVDPAYTPASNPVPYNAANVVLLAANAARYKYRICNLSDRVLYVMEGGVAAAADCSYAIQPNQVYESQCRVTVEIDGIGAAGGAGNYMVTEFTI